MKSEGKQGSAKPALCVLGETVFGAEWFEIQERLKAAYADNPPLGIFSFEQFARRVLKGCRELRGSSPVERRRKYIEACIRRLAPLSFAVDAEPDIDIAYEDPIVLFSRRARITVLNTRRLVLEYIRAANRPGRNDLEFRVWGVLERAAAAKYPKRYLLASIRNEKARK